MMKPSCKATLQRHFSLLIFHYWMGIYRPQTKFAKVMFSQVSVCPRGEVSVQGWSLSRGISVQVSGGLCLRVPVQTVSVTETPPRVTVMYWWYASYWNAFLLTDIFRHNIENIFVCDYLKQGQNTSKPTVHSTRGRQSHLECKLPESSSTAEPVK